VLVRRKSGDFYFGAKFISGWECDPQGVGLEGRAFGHWCASGSRWTREGFFAEWVEQLGGLMPHASEGPSVTREDPSSIRHEVG